MAKNIKNINVSLPIYLSAHKTRNIYRVVVEDYRVVVEQDNIRAKYEKHRQIYCKRNQQ